MACLTHIVCLRLLQKPSRHLSARENPNGIPLEVFDGFRTALAANRETLRQQDEFNTYRHRIILTTDNQWKVDQLLLKF